MKRNRIPHCTDDFLDFLEDHYPIHGKRIADLNSGAQMVRITYPLVGFAISTLIVVLLIFGLNLLSQYSSPETIPTQTVHEQTTESSVSPETSDSLKPSEDTKENTKEIAAKKGVMAFISKNTIEQKVIPITKYSGIAIIILITILGLIFGFHKAEEMKYDSEKLVLKTKIDYKLNVLLSIKYTHSHKTKTSTQTADVSDISLDKSIP